MKKIIVVSIFFLLLISGLWAQTTFCSTWTFNCYWYFDATEGYPLPFVGYSFGIQVYDSEKFTQEIDIGLGMMYLLLLGDFSVELIGRSLFNKDKKKHFGIEYGVSFRYLFYALGGSDDMVFGLRINPQLRFLTKRNNIFYIGPGIIGYITDGFLSRDECWVDTEIVILSFGFSKYKHW